MTGIPVLGMLDGEGARIIAESKSGLCVPASDFNGLAAAAIKMSKYSFKNKQELGKNGILYSKVEFDRSILMDRLENFFISAVSQHNNIT